MKPHEAMIPYCGNCSRKTKKEGLAKDELSVSHKILETIPRMTYEYKSKLPLSRIA